MTYLYLCTKAVCLLFIHPPAHGSEVSPAARNTLDSARIPRASKLLICGLFLKGRVLAQDGERSVARTTATAAPQRGDQNKARARPLAGHYLESLWPIVARVNQDTIRWEPA